MRSALVGLLTLSFASAASAVTFVEIGDAPQSVPGQDTVGGMQPLVEIVGTFAGFSDVDIYRIDIVDPANFRATTSGNDALDTQLFLFDSLGFGIAANDDRSNLADECAPFQDCWSDLGSIPGLSAGMYSLAVSRYPYVPVSNSGSIFPLDLVSETLDPFVGRVDPTGPGAGNPLAAWTNPFSVEDPFLPDYTVSLTGVAGVPEPATGLLVILGLVGFAAKRRFPQGENRGEVIH